MKRIYVAVLSVMAAANVWAADDASPYDDKLLGDLGGARTQLVDEGVDVNLHYSGDLWDVLDGGKKRIATYLDYTELRANLDGEKLFGIPGNTVSVSLVNSNGTRTNGSTVGSIQGIDNNEVASNGVRLYEAWVQQNFLADRVSVRLGIQDMNTDNEFASTPVSDNFLQPGMQLGQSFNDSGRNGPSSFPYDSVGARVRVKPTEETYLAVAAYDGIPGDARTTSGDDIHFNRKDGLLLISEAGFTPTKDDTVNKLAVGVWHYTGGIPELINPAAEGTAEGFYVLSSARFYQDDAGRDFSAFLRGGGAADATAETNWDVESGIVAHGWVPGRPADEIGAGVALAHNGAAYMTAEEAAGTPASHVETAYELYYRDSIARGVMLQPDMQYIVHPGTNPVLADAWVAGIRLDVTF